MISIPREPPGGGPRRRRVLGVDDDPVMRHLIEGYLRANGYEVALAANVPEARSQLESRGRGHFDCVITDFNMPGETGLDLLVWLKGHDPELASIMITAAGERQIIAESLRAGASNFLDKPVRLADLLRAVNEGSALTERRREATKSVADVRDVSRTQNRMIGRLHRAGIEGLDLRHFPMHEAGGDFAAVLPLAERSALLIAADVSGHDIRAAFVSAYFQGLTRGLLESRSPASRVLAQFNDYLVKEWNDDGTDVPTSLSVVAVEIHRAEDRATVHNHGAPGIHRIADDGEVTLVHPGGGSPLGWFDDLAGSETAELRLSDGGWLVLWTDGLEEQAGKLGVDPWALACALRDAPSVEGQRPEILREAPDDVMLLWFPLAEGAVTAPAWKPVIATSYHGGQVGDIDLLQNQWEWSLKMAVPEMPEDRLYEIILCLREGVLNALNHGCRRDPALRTRVQVRRQTGGTSVRVVIQDPGNGHDFDWKRHNSTSAENLDDRHRGLAFLHSFPTAIQVERNGAWITMDFDSEPTPSPQ